MKYLIAILIILFVFRWFFFGFWRGFWDAVMNKPYDDSLFDDDEDVSAQLSKYSTILEMIRNIIPKKAALTMKSSMRVMLLKTYI